MPKTAEKPKKVLQRWKARRWCSKHCLMGPHSDLPIEHRKDCPAQQWWYPDAIQKTGE